MCEIGARAFENTMDYADLTSFIGLEYPGYTVEFRENGVFVDEGQDLDAIRHYFQMSENGAIIYEAYYKVPGVHYMKHKIWFDEFAEGMEIL